MDVLSPVITEEIVTEADQGQSTFETQPSVTRADMSCTGAAVMADSEQSAFESNPAGEADVTRTGCQGLEIPQVPLIDRILDVLVVMQTPVPCRSSRPRCAQQRSKGFSTRLVLFPVAQDRRTLVAQKNSSQSSPFW